ncbi:aspartate aminotransferase family protein [Candidatus Parcubacteria bacterium]|nr:MAG: aspartate aminotransferase family protein [Candidatus Parcubacteria bacterium]
MKQKTHGLPKSLPNFSLMADQEVFEIEEKFGANHYGRVGLSVHKMQGAWLYDRQGKRYLDCLAAYSAANQGHHHPFIVEAVKQALEENYASVVSNVVYTPYLAAFLEKLTCLLPPLGIRFGDQRNKALLKNGGVESVETALKVMRCYGHKVKGIPDGKQEIIVFRNNFHGRTLAVVSFSSTEKYRAGFGPIISGFREAEFGDLGSVEKLINPHTCGILVEPMQGEGGMYVPPPGFLKGLRELADFHDLFLVFDEIQVGLGRTGKMFCFEHEGVIPDGIILGKALSGGMLPLSAFVTNSEVMNLVFQPGRDGSTFGGYPLACVAGLAALEVITKERLVENSARRGLELKARIQEIAKHSPLVKEVRGRGLFIGIEVKGGDAMKYCQQLLGYGLLVNDSHGHTIRISPPLIIGGREINYLCRRLEKVLCP